MNEENFNSRLESAISRGQRRADAKASARRQQQLTAEELRQKHTAYRLALSERIEKTVHGVADHFPGFREESLFGEVGWGAACFRDDLKMTSGRRDNLYSRLEMVVPAYTDLGVLELKSKSTVANRELFNRSHYAPIAEVEIDEFERLVDTWAIEFAEQYAAKR